MRDRLANVFNRAADLRESTSVVPASALVTPLRWLFNIRRLVSRYATLLVFVLISFGCAMITAPAFISAMYPIELGVREGTNWLHALALSRGINIFDPATVAYINMPHGPMDAIAKSLIISVFPDGPASVITRSFCMLLPLIIIASSLFLLKNRQFPVLKGLILTFITYGLIIINPTYGSFVGRSDPTALCFGFLAAAVMLGSVDGTRPTIYAFGSIGLLLSLMILTNWRFIAVVPFMLIAWRYYGGLMLRPTLSDFVACFAGLTLPLLFVLHHYYAWNLDLYYKHYFGFYGPDSGWGRSFSESIGSFASTTAALFHLEFPIGVYLLLGAIIVSIGLFAVAAIEGSDHREQWLFCALLFAAAVFVHYLVAALGPSGLYYMKPALIVAWMCGIILCMHLNTMRFPTLGLISIAIIFVVVVRVVTPQYVFFAKSFPEALEYAGAVQLVEAEAPIYTEGHFFFVRSHIPMIDMGDTVSIVEKTGYYGPAFSRRFRENLNRLTLTPPTYVVHSNAIDSPELNRIVDSQYVEVRCAPKYFWLGRPPCLYRLAVRNQ
jgi:hypothetical protein